MVTIWYCTPARTSLDCSLRRGDCTKTVCGTCSVKFQKRSADQYATALGSMRRVPITNAFSVQTRSGPR